MQGKAARRQTRRGPDPSMFTLGCACESGALSWE